MRQQFTSSGTSVNKNRCPAIYNNVYVIPYLMDKKVLDYGAGKYDTGKMRGMDYRADVWCYDPYNRGPAENYKAYTQWDYDVVICSNVLNVLKEPEVREEEIRSMGRHCKPNGMLFFTVYEGDRSGVGKQTGPDKWQENRTIKSYEPEIAKALGPRFFGSVCKHGVITVFIN